MFQIIKCDGANCCSPMKNPNGKLPWLLNPVLCADKTHFTPFDEIVGKETTKKDLPSANIPRTMLLKCLLYGKFKKCQIWERFLTIF